MTLLRVPLVACLSSQALILTDMVVPMFKPDMGSLEAQSVPSSTSVIITSGIIFGVIFLILLTPLLMEGYQNLRGILAQWRDRFAPDLLNKYFFGRRGRDAPRPSPFTHGRSPVVAIRPPDRVFTTEPPPPYDASRLPGYVQHDSRDTGSERNISLP
ncbi:hypothetical protein FKP32DRAFT_1673816 [Trametes sanguinea]|nr:hypothetical protein FKP32DRAFT_1673816 [Trametes sanguinea]